MAPPPPPSGGGERASSACLYSLSCIFFLLTLAGGSMVLLYITLPESDNTSWFPIAGITLIGIPWAFWFVMSLYRIALPCINRLRPKLKSRPSAKTEAKAIEVGEGEGEVVIDVEGGSKAEFSEGGTRKVRFGEDDDNHDSERPLTSSMS